MCLLFLCLAPCSFLFFVFYVLFGLDVVGVLCDCGSSSSVVCRWFLRLFVVLSVFCSIVIVVLSLSVSCSRLISMLLTLSVSGVTCSVLVR